MRQVPALSLICVHSLYTAHVSRPQLQLKRVHFHDFMLDVHGRLRRLSAQSDPLARVADDIAEDVKARRGPHPPISTSSITVDCLDSIEEAAWRCQRAGVTTAVIITVQVLALDEFFVTDVADAVILARLFGRLWDRGLVLVATSNRRPDALYEGGLQRMLFVPFIDRLKASASSQCSAKYPAHGKNRRRLLLRIDMSRSGWTLALSPEPRVTSVVSPQRLPCLQFVKAS